jgi:hypothetical protein
MTQLVWQPEPAGQDEAQHFVRQRRDRSFARSSLDYVEPSASASGGEPVQSTKPNGGVSVIAEEDDRSRAGP